ncbi:MAG: hypothetical protein JNN15_20095, partial [Blastocatellia bacterium]|nr:hypothetical protein [Blastocatellia bacterium]
MVVGPAFVEYNHRFTCPYCQTYNQILLDRAMFEQAQVMIMHQPPVETFEPDTESIKTQEGPALQNQNQFEADIPTLLVMPSDLFPENKAPVLSSKNSPPSFESATETSTATLEAKTKVAAIEKLGKEQKQPPVFEQAPSPKKASSSVIKIAGREIEQRLLILGGGGALAVVAVIVFFLFKSDPVPPPRPVPPIVGQKQLPTTPPKPTPNQVVQ